MATYTATRAGSTYQARANIAETRVTSSYTFTVAPANGDVVQMVKIPVGAIIQDVTLSSTDIDTNGTPTVSLVVGDGSDTDRFITTSTIGRAGGVARLDSQVGHGYAYTAEDTIDVVITAGPATAAVGTFVLTVDYTMEGVS